MGMAPSHRGHLSVPASWDPLPLRGVGKDRVVYVLVGSRAGGGSFATFPGEMC